MILELKSNGSFYIRSEQAGYSGKYSINNAELFLKGDAGIAMKFAVRSEDTPVEDTGEVYKRR